MFNALNNKVVLITGSNGGIGKVLCSEFKKNNFTVFGLDITENQNSEIDFFFEIDLDLYVSSKTYRVAKNNLILEKISTLDLIINNAATQILSDFKNIEIEDWQKTLNINLSSVFLLVQLLLPKLTKNKGNVINISSIHANQTKKGFVAYATSKSALVGFTKALSIEIGEQVRVNAICPAAIETNMLYDSFSDKAMVDNLKELHPVQEIGTPLDVARLSLFLAHNENRFLNGSVITLDGGISNKLVDLA